jgi:hypothetical protein
LWSRTGTSITRALANLTGTTVRATDKTVRASFTKVAEYQQRGVIHLHVVIRLDARRHDGVTMLPPAPFNNPDLLASAVITAITRTTVPDLLTPGTRIGWGPQSVVRVITNTPDNTNRDEHDNNDGDDGTRTALAVASYVSKYVTKDVPRSVPEFSSASESPYVLDWDSTDPFTAPTPVDSPEQRRREHWERLAETCRDLARRSVDTKASVLNLPAKVYGIGYPDRAVSRSRTYSASLAALQQERRDHQATRAARNENTPNPTTGGGTVPVGTWGYMGYGWANNGETAWTKARSRERLDMLAEARAERARQRRHQARDDDGEPGPT